ncbi:hypothetical protein IE53DRAFT_366341 [Violaceomyces palustris]|uniref:Uncharacterized protein n=1 Tax=Violaceomyces palustris TaxID=1673888 RepID=A0ACD0P5W9_9BASI|nr:hypothetical protein IE53DRAFT_366341 [Violaceomyces palustris]
MHDVLKEEGAKDCGEATEKENDVKIDFDPEDLPAEIHHCLSRIIGIQMLPDTSVVPGTSAERLLRRELSDDDEEIPQTKASEGGDATEGDGHAPLSDGAEVAIEEGSRSPTLPTKRPRRISNEGAGSHNSRRSPRKKLNRPDPESPEANFLPRSERKMVHPSHGKHQPFDGDLSFETLEGEEGMEEDVQDATTPGVGLGFTEEQVDEVMEDATEAPPATVVVKEGKAGTSSSKSKRRTSGRRSLGTDPSFKPDKEDVAAAFESEEEEQANKPSRRKATTGRKRAPSLLSVGVEVADSVTTPKRTRRSEPASSAAFKPPKTVEGEDDSDDQDPNPDPTLRETRARREEKEVIHQVLGDDQVENLHEQEEESKGKGKKKGGVATTSNKARSTRRQSSRSSARRN